MKDAILISKLKYEERIVINSHLYYYYPVIIQLLNRRSQRWCSLRLPGALPRTC